MNYTKGEWFIERGQLHGPGECRIMADLGVVDGADTVRQVCIFDNYAGCPEESEADAYLVAAAPEMYEAMTRFVSDFPDFEALFPDTYKRFRVALAKAEGKGE